MHLDPVAGRPRDVATAIVDTLYPAGTPSRIPTVAVTGTNGKTTTARLTAALLRRAGHRVGLTTTDGVYVDGRLVESVVDEPSLRPGVNGKSGLGRHQDPISPTKASNTRAGGASMRTATATRAVTDRARRGA